MWFHC